MHCCHKVGKACPDSRRVDSRLERYVTDKLRNPESARWHIVCIRLRALNCTPNRQPKPLCCDDEKARKGPIATQNRYATLYQKPTTFPNLLNTTRSSRTAPGYGRLVGNEAQALGGAGGGGPGVSEVLADGDDVELADGDALEDEGLAGGAGEAVGVEEGHGGVDDEVVADAGEDQAADGLVAQVAAGLVVQVGDGGGEEVERGRAEGHVGGAAREEAAGAGQAGELLGEVDLVESRELGVAVAHRVGVEGQHVVAGVDVVRRQLAGQDSVLGVGAGFDSADGSGAGANAGSEEDGSSSEGLHFVCFGWLGCYCKTDVIRSR